MHPTLRYRLIGAALLALFASATAWSAAVWKWTDKEGTVHYSDQPVPGAVRVDINVQTYKPEDVQPFAPRTPVQPAPAATPSYQSIDIVQPGKDETISGTGGKVSVGISVQPNLMPGHSVFVLMDGHAVSPPDSTATHFVVKDVPRGAHTLTASVVSNDGQTLIQSSPITFYVHQASVLNKKK